MPNDIIVEVSDPQPIIVEVESISADLPAGTNDGDILIWNTISEIWEASGFGGSVIHNDLTGLQGGTTDEYYHLLLAEYTELNEWLDDVTLGSNGLTTIPQLVLIPSPAAISAVEGGIFYNNVDKAVYVCTETWRKLAFAGINADITSMTGLDDDGIPLAKVANAIGNLVEDTTPELGGELDAGAHSIGFTQQSTTGDGTTTIDWKLGNKFKFTFGAQNDTFTFTAPTNPCNLLLMLIQDGVGSRLATWPGTVKWANGTAPTLSTTAGTIDICSFYWDGTNYFGVGNNAFAVPA